MTTYKNFIEVFDSVNAFAEAINTRKVNPNCSANGECSKKTGREFEEFTGTKDYETANGLLLNGDGANLDKLQAVNVNINTPSISNELKNTLVKSVCGGVPLVPLALIGVPKNMLATRKAPKTAKVVNIIYDAVFSGGVAATDIIKAGAKVASLVKALEARKVRVNLFVAAFSSEKLNSGQVVGCLVNIKKAAAPLNMLRIAYPLINPSFLRRSWFRWYETMPAKISPRLFAGNYGKCEKAEKHKNEIGIKNTIYISGAEMIDADINDEVKKYFAK